MRPLRSPAVAEWTCATFAGLSIAAAIFFLLIAFTESNSEAAFLPMLIALANAGHWLALMTIIGLLDRIANRK